jgi:hypothetical protein
MRYFVLSWLVLCLSTTAYAFDQRLFDKLDSVPKPTVKPAQKPSSKHHQRIIKKHHRTKKVEVEPKVYAEPALEVIPSAEAVPSVNENVAIGKNYQGGIIFYIDNSGKHGLIAAPTDQSMGIQWCNDCYFENDWHDVVRIGATGKAFGTGQANTRAIINSQNTGSDAAKLCDDLVLNGYDDWYLPSKDELNLMYQNIGQGASGALKNRGGFASNYYWSSSDYDGYNAWYQNLLSGTQNKGNKDGTLYVRAVRAF